MFDRNSQDVSAKNRISETRTSVFLQLLMNVSAEIIVFQNSRDVSMKFLIFSIDITVGISAFLLILDVFPS